MQTEFLYFGLLVVAVAIIGLGFIYYKEKSNK